MGLEKRGNNYYYYRKERMGSRVVSIYEGKGLFAQLMARMEGAREEEESVKRERRAAEKTEQQEIDRNIDAACYKVSICVDALFLTMGYRQHSRTWRRKRNG